MDKHTGSRPGFHRSDAAWYARGAGITQPEIVVGLYAADGSGFGEARLEWEPDLGCAVHVYDDAWSLFARPEFAGLWSWLAAHDGQAVSADAVVAELLRLGFADLTHYEEPE